MWFLIALACVTASIALIGLVRARRLRLRESRLIVGELKDVAKLLADPVHAREVAFTGPHRCDEDRAYDTMFTARHGQRLLSLILDTSRRRVRWWVLYELYAPGTGERTLRKEAVFDEAAIPHDAIRTLLQAARGEPATKPAQETESQPATESRVDPFEQPPSDPLAPAVQA